MPARNKRCYDHLPHQRANARTGEAGLSRFNMRMGALAVAFFPRAAKPLTGGRCLLAGLPAWQTDGGKENQDSGELASNVARAATTR